MFVAGPSVPYSCRLRSARRPATRPFSLWGIAMAERAGAVRKDTNQAIPARIATESETPEMRAASDRRARAATKPAHGTTTAAVAKKAPVKKAPVKKAPANSE